MRPSVLVPAVLLLCSCAKGEERPPTAKADSSVTADLDFDASRDNVDDKENTE